MERLDTEPVIQVCVRARVGPKPEIWTRAVVGPARGPKFGFGQGPARPDFEKIRPVQPLLGSHGLLGLENVLI